MLKVGETNWGSLEKVAKEKGFNDEEIIKFVEEIRNLKS